MNKKNVSAFDSNLSEDLQEGGCFVVKGENSQDHTQKEEGLGLNNSKTLQHLLPLSVLQQMGIPNYG